MPQLRNSKYFHTTLNIRTSMYITWAWYVVSSRSWILRIAEPEASHQWRKAAGSSSTGQVAIRRNCRRDLNG
eukprot:scaffold279657_cov37-Prasinocladus_malaysianus.AAC.1